MKGVEAYELTTHGVLMKKTKRIEILSIFCTILIVFQATLPTIGVMAETISTDVVENKPQTVEQTNQPAEVPVQQQTEAPVQQQSEISTKADSDPVTIQDQIVEEDVRTKLGIPEPTPITKGDMKRLTTLKVSNAGSNSYVYSLAGLEYAVNLTSLDVEGVRLSDSDLVPLTNLTSLQTLELDTLATGASVKFSDLTPLANLTNLTTLKLPMQNISDISVLSNFSKLQILDLGYNSIEDITAIKNLTTLRELHLNDNDIDNADLAELIINLDNLIFLDPKLQIQMQQTSEENQV